MQIGRAEGEWSTDGMKGKGMRCKYAAQTDIGPVDKAEVLGKWLNQPKPQILFFNSVFCNRVDTRESAKVAVCLEREFVLTGQE